MKFAIFEDILDNTSLIFTEVHSEIIAHNESELDDAFTKLNNLPDSLYAVGYVSYELSNHTHKQQNPLLHFVVYTQKTTIKSHELQNNLAQFIEIKDNNITQKINFIESEIDYQKYQTLFHQVIDNLRQGNSYQINLTQRFKLDLQHTDKFLLYHQLSRHNPVKYAAYLPFDYDTIISISPELFFRKQHNKITLNPMKGTAKRSYNHVEDLLIKQQLQSDEKNRSENLIIVDLMRNDLAKIAKTGTVKVERLFHIEEYKTVYQMTSEISAIVDDNIDLKEIFSALFPCGSITGAPKKRTMELIQQIEPSQRGIYTGAIGYRNSKDDMLFNVAIRTISDYGASNFASVGAGGGITINSTANDEWHEIKTKLKFITRFYEPDFTLIESLLIKNNLICNLTEHLQRLQSSANKLLFDYDINKVTTELNDFIKHNILQASRQYKLRLELRYDGDCKFEVDEIQNITKKYRVMLLSHTLDTSHPLFQHKTTSPIVRGLYTNLDYSYKPEGIDEIIFMNTQQEITESRFYNIIIEYNNKLITPPLTCGLLNGIYRQQMINQSKLCEMVITADMLMSASKIFLCNDVRGLIECEFCGIIK